MKTPDIDFYYRKFCRKNNYVYDKTSFYAGMLAFMEILEGINNGIDTNKPVKKG
jgi:hypothetical protein